MAEETGISWTNATIAALQEENRDLVHALERFVTAAQSWHDFHKHAEGIQCDLLCEAIAPSRAVLERTTKNAVL
jgi:hypothetical protein